jgi:hypothetical protein
MVSLGMLASQHATTRAIVRAVDFPRSVLARGGGRVLRIVFRGWRSEWALGQERNGWPIHDRLRNAYVLLKSNVVFASFKGR